MTLSPRMRVVLRVAGYVMLGLVTFVYALHLTFPYERVRDKVVEAFSSKYDVTVGDVERSVVPGRFAITNLTLQSRPSVAGQPVTTMFFKRVEIDLKLLPLLSRTMAVDLDVSTGGGHATGSVRIGKSGTKIDFRLHKVPLATLPGITDAVGLPMAGNGDGRLTLSLPGSGDWSRATGKFELSSAGMCTVGDGVTRIYPQARREADKLLVKDGIPVPTVSIAHFKLGIDIAKGEAVRRTFEFQSPDGEVGVDFDIKLARSIKDSTITGCIRYKCSESYRTKASATCDLGSPAVDEDGFRNIKLTGKLSAMRRRGLVCDASADDVFSKGEPGSERVRPVLEAAPEPSAPEPPPPPPPPSPDPPAVEPPPAEMGRPMPGALSPGDTNGDGAGDSSGQPGVVPPGGPGQPAGVTGTDDDGSQPAQPGDGQVPPPQVQPPGGVMGAQPPDDGADPTRVDRRTQDPNERIEK